MHEGETVPLSFVLDQNFPNPFNPATRIRYQVPEATWVTLKVFDFLVRNLSTLVNERKPVGSYTVTFDGLGLASGVYFYQFLAGAHAVSRAMLLIR